MQTNKKAQGLVTGIITGIGFLVITTIVIFLVTSSVNNAGLLTDRTGSSSQDGITLDHDGTTLTVCNSVGAADPSIATLTVVNATGGETLTAANYSTSGCVITNLGGGIFNGTLVNVSAYTYTYNPEKTTTDQMMNNFTTGVNNVSNKLPTILLIAAVIILFGAIVLLVKQSRQISGSTGAGL